MPASSSVDCTTNMVFFHKLRKWKPESCLEWLLGSSFKKVGPPTDETKVDPANMMWRVSAGETGKEKRMLTLSYVCVCSKHFLTDKLEIKVSF